MYLEEIQGIRGEVGKGLTGAVLMGGEACRVRGFRSSKGALGEK